MQRTLYVKESDWLLIKSMAKKMNRSFSNYLVDLHRANLVAHDLGFAPEKLVHAGHPDSERITDEALAVSKRILESTPDPVQKTADDLAELTEGNTTFKPLPKTDKKGK